MCPRNWRAWRGQKRSEMIAARNSLTAAERAQRNAAIDTHLQVFLFALSGLTVSFYWPIRGEPDPRPAIRRWRAVVGQVALPVVVAPGMPLAFRAWRPDVQMQSGGYGILFPANTHRVAVDAAMIPLVGFDRGGYRLGYGGGYFDRTLAAYIIKPISIGVGYELAKIRTLHPQPHDMPMDFVVTDAGIRAQYAGRLYAVTAEDVQGRIQGILAERRNTEAFDPLLTTSSW